MSTFEAPRTGSDYSFPYAQPYEIQLQLMTHLFASLSSRQVTVIESPTGTGKSLSLISSTLTWLRFAKELERERIRKEVEEEVRASGEEDEPEWVRESEVRRRLDALERSERELEERLRECRRLEKDRDKDGRSRKRMRLDDVGGGKGKEKEDEYAPDPYYEEGDERPPAEGDNVDPKIREMMARLIEPSKKKEVEEPDVLKIFYASRTHSQLSQFVSEVRKTSFASSPSTSSHLPTPTTSPDPSTSSIPSPSHAVRVIPLGSRQNLCINDEVKAKAGGSNDALGDLCLELQKGGKEEKRCKFLPRAEEGGAEKMSAFRDRALAQVHDIEDIEDLGRKMHTCPYYGSRKAVRSAEIVTLPYNMLMSKSAREALGISLKDHVVVIDEAHNLIQTLLDMHSVTITSSILSSLRGALVTYFTKFKNRFKGSNAQYLRQLLLVLKALSAFVDEWGAKGEKEKMMSVNEVVKEMKGSVDQVNMIKLDRYLKESHIARKIGGYLDLLEEEKTPAGRQAARSNATRNLHRIQAFLVSLTNATGDGRILLNAERVPSASGTGGPTRVEVTMKYMLLAPSESFREVAEEARSVVLAGGTMAPMSDFKEQLFPYLPIERFSTFSCGHIVAPDRVTTVAVAKGPTGIKLNFTFDNRKDEKLIDEMGLAILNISTVVPKGVVVFVPSKDFLAQIQTRWEKSGFLEKLGKRKKIFWEPKERVDVDPTLREYAAANKGDQHGAILFAVVDAKLSEGINFADDMARAVIIVGIPYPSRHSTEIKERMAYLNSQPRSSTLPKGKDPGMVLYQNMAFRGVNQSIGRAIRHQFDWAAIVLLDERYTMPNNQAQLPAWLGSDVKSPPTFGGVMKEVSLHCGRLKKG